MNTPASCSICNHASEFIGDFCIHRVEELKPRQDVVDFSKIMEMRLQQTESREDFEVPHGETYILNKMLENLNHVRQALETGGLERQVIVACTDLANYALALANEVSK